MPPSRHVCGPKVPQRPTPCDGLLPTGNVEEVALPVGGGVNGGYIEVTNSLWVPPLPDHLLQLPGVRSHGRGIRLASGGPQPMAR